MKATNNDDKSLEYKVSTFRECGLDAKWSKTRSGKPIIVVRDPESELPHQRNQWWWLDSAMYKAMQNEGVKQGFNSSTIIADIFSIAV